MTDENHIKEIKKKYKTHWLYYPLSLIARISFHKFYQKIEHNGTENIPCDAHIIYAANHTNALMDALSILYIDYKPKYFLGRADMFKNPIIAKLLSFIKIMPIMRIRDGFNAVKKDFKQIEIASEILETKTPICIFPEGTHQSLYSLLNFTKGIFRIAIMTQKRLNEPIYIVPIDIEYGNFYRYRSTVMTNIGKAINIQEYINNHKDLSEAELINSMRENLMNKFKDLILYIPNDEYYAAKYDCCSIVFHEQKKRNRKIIQYSQYRKKLLDKSLNNQKTISEIEDFIKTNPSEAKIFLNKIKKISEKRHAEHISLKSIIMKYPKFSLFIRSLILLILSPYLIAAATVTFPLTLINIYISKKIEDKTFLNSLKFGVCFLVWPIFVIIYAVILFWIFKPLWAIIGILLLSIVNPNIRDAHKTIRLMISDVKLMKNQKLEQDISEVKKYYLTHIIK
ncbi:MAG: 1-acyl-sn-glycerol-3-phosphate acyltransferase [Bacteroidales bacterium]